MENDTHPSSISRSAPLAVNAQCPGSQPLGGRNSGAIGHPRLRRYSSLTTQRTSISLASQSGWESKQPLKSSRSLGEIVLSFQFPPPLLSDSEGEEDNDETAMDLKITPVFTKMRINRPRCYSANDALQAEGVEWAVEVGDLTSIDRKLLAAERSKREMKEHHESAKEAYGRASIREELEMSRRRYYSDGDGDRMPIYGNTFRAISKSTASSDEDVFLPSCRSPISNPGGMGIQNGSPNGTMKVVPDDLSNTPSTPSEMLQMLHGMSPKTPVGLMMIPKGTVRPPNAMVKIPNGTAESLPELMKTASSPVKSPKKSKKIQNTHAITKTQLSEVEAQDWLMPDVELDSRKSFQIPYPPKTPKPQQLSRLGAFQRRRVRPPHLQLQHTLKDPDGSKAMKTPDDEQMCSFSGNRVQRPGNTPGNTQNRRLEERQHEQITSPRSPGKQLILRVSLEAVEECN